MNISTWVMLGRNCVANVWYIADSLPNPHTNRIHLRIISYYKDFHRSVAKIHKTYMKTRDHPQESCKSENPLQKISRLNNRQFQWIPRRIWHHSLLNKTVISIIILCKYGNWKLREGWVDVCAVYVQPRWKFSCLYTLGPRQRRQPLFGVESQHIDEGRWRIVEERQRPLVHRWTAGV